MQITSPTGQTICLFPLSFVSLSSEPSLPPSKKRITYLPILDMPPSEEIKLRAVSPRPDFKANYLEFANAPAIVRANQKDSYFETVLRDKLQNVIQIFKGQRFTHTHPEEIGVAAKALYLSLTTLLGTKTLGEEYVDLIYVSRDGKRIPRYLARAGFIFAYAILPYFLARLFRRLKSSPTPKDEVTEEKINKELPISLRIEKYLSNMSYSKVLDTIMNLHIAVFYFSGQFYNISKRFFSMRYAFGHKINKERTPNGNYELLGGLIVLQLVMKSLGGFKGLIGSFTGNDEHDESNLRANNKDIMYGIPSEEEQEEAKQQLGIIDLSDPSQLPYIPESSRQCMLCLSYMTNPTAANCGHCFCWSCIIDWCKERPECPLCRQKVLEQQLLPLH